MDGEYAASKLFHIAKTLVHQTTHEEHPTNKLKLTNVTM
jgi:hypothetical protein